MSRYLPNILLFMLQFATNTRLLREQKGLSQSALGKEIGVGRTTITSYESGRSTPDYKTLYELGKIFAISLEELLFTNLSKVNDLDTHIDEHPNVHINEPIKVGQSKDNKLEKEIERLMEINKAYKETIETQKDLIIFLKKQIVK